ncbi:hypothetical protein [Paenibacillus cremeus]|uniref:Uncharacterized protein n=1 Tax=Paenibacillus cremeus TaxID=2163881 RepID=A0A559JGJ9_9BACL|nr:hypothetical protein [Paenibacillus cremeus]TVX98996.1 hypothetical protein FPZ49_34115 [Paenibacillus cremeus]
MKGKQDETFNRTKEILDFKEKLSELFNIRITDLAVDVLTDDNRLTMIEIGKTLAQSKGLMNRLLMEKKLPVQQLLNTHNEILGEMLEGNQQYVIAMALILYGPYPCLRKYLNLTLSEQ